MISFSSLKQVGGFGNQLFQVATTLAVSLSKNVSYGLPDWVGNYIFRQPFSRLSKMRGFYLYNSHKFFSKPSIKNIYYPNRIFRQNGFDYKSLDHLPDNVDLLGYFQSSKYFIKYEESVKNYYTLNNECQIFIDRLFKNYTKEHSNVVSIHVRRGDYINMKDKYPFCGKKYYEKAMKLFDKDSLFLLFSDDMEWCRSNLVRENIVYVDTQDIKTPIDKYFQQGYRNNCNENNQWVDLLLMSKSNHNIIANSSFSWWGSWLNKNPNKRVIAPKKWLGDSFKLRNIFQDDIYEDSWIIITTD